MLKFETHIKLIGIAFGTFALVTASAASVSADSWNAIPFSNFVQTDAPVQVIEGSAYTSNDHSEVLACVGFVNNAKVIATVVQYRFFEADPFKELLVSDTVNIQGNFGPGARINILRAVNGMPRTADRCYDKSSDEKTSQVIVRLEKVLFLDGTVWARRQQ